MSHLSVSILDFNHVLYQGVHSLNVKHICVLLNEYIMELIMWKKKKDTDSHFSQWVDSVEKEIDFQY